MKHQSKIQARQTFTVLVLSAHSYYNRAIYGVVYTYPRMKVQEIVSLDGLRVREAYDIIQRLKKKWDLSGLVDVHYVPAGPAIIDEIRTEREAQHGKG